MQINRQLMDELYNDIGPERLQKAKEYVTNGRLQIKKVIYDNQNNFEVMAEIDGNYDDYTTKIKVVNGELEIAECQCQDYMNRYGSCKHITATLIKFGQTKYWDKYDERPNSKTNIHKFANFRKIVTDLYNEELQDINTEELEQLPEEKKIKIEPKIIFDRFDSKLKLEFKIGQLII